MRKKSIALLALCWLCMLGPEETRGQNCPDTSGSHRFSHQGEVIDIPILLADCRPLALELHWSNGRNNGSNFKVMLLDTNGRPIYVKRLSAFQTGAFELPFATLEARRVLGSQSIIALPASVTIQAIRPFAFPASISYTVSRAASSPRAIPFLDRVVVSKLEMVAGRVLLSGHSSLQGTPEASITYRLEEVQLDGPRMLEVRGQKVGLETALRLVLTGNEVLNGAELIWIGDAALPAFRRRSGEIGALIFDQSVINPVAELSISEASGRSYPVTDKLTLPPDFSTSWQRSNNGSKHVDGAVVVIRKTSRTIGRTRLSLIQIELETVRPFPASEAALQVQIGKRIFLDEVTGDHSGRRLTLTLTPGMFSELRDGAEIFAFFGRPDHSGFVDTWRFGRLDKERMKAIVNGK